MIDRFEEEHPGFTVLYEPIPYEDYDQAVLCLMGDFLKDALHPAIREDLDCFSFPALDLSIPRGETAPSEGFLVSEEGSRPEGGGCAFETFHSGRSYGLSASVFS